MALKRQRDDTSEESGSEGDFELGPAPKTLITTLETRIDGSNIGSVLLRKMGYVSGGLGAKPGRADPVPFAFKDEKLGLGKGELETHVLSNTTLTQKRMASVLMLDETESERLKRENKVAERERIQAELAETLKTYLCVDCEKQYRNIRQYNDHLQSYDHHHRKRFKAMQADQRANAAASGDLDKRREKERKRETAELARMGVESGFIESSASMPASSDTVEPKAGHNGGFKKLKSEPTRVTLPCVNVPLPTQATKAPAFRSSGFVTLDTGSAALPATVSEPVKTSGGLKLALGTNKPSSKPLLAQRPRAFEQEDEPEDAGTGSAMRIRGLGKAPALNGIKISLAPKR